MTRESRPAGDAYSGGDGSAVASKDRKERGPESCESSLKGRHAKAEVPSALTEV